METRPDSTQTSSPSIMTSTAHARAREHFGQARGLWTGMSASRVSSAGSHGVWFAASLSAALWNRRCVPSLDLLGTLCHSADARVACRAASQPRKVVSGRVRALVATTSRRIWTRAIAIFRVGPQGWAMEDIRVQCGLRHPLGGRCRITTQSGVQPTSHGHDSRLSEHRVFHPGRGTWPWALAVGCQCRLGGPAR